jgi:FkbM family methyltransferase
MLASYEGMLFDALLKVRPAPVASFLKRCLGIRRRIVDTEIGRFWIDPASMFGREISTTGCYEPRMVDLMRRFLPRGGIFIDVGANEGYFTVAGAKIAGQEGRVLAVEPQERLLPIIRRNLQLNDVHNAAIECAAVSDHEGSANFHLAPDTNNGTSSLHNPVRYRVRTAKVPLRRLATILDEHQIARVDFMKMDIEGAEYEAVLGSLELFHAHRIRTIALELHPVQLNARGRGMSEVVGPLEAVGYREAAPSVWSLD